MFSLHLQYRQGIDSTLRSGKDQVDIKLLDFSKAFDKVTHLWLLHKMNFYRVRGDTLRRSQSFLSYRKQQFVYSHISVFYLKFLRVLSWDPCCFWSASATHLSAIHHTRDYLLVTHYYTDRLEATVMSIPKCTEKCQIINIFTSSRLLHKAVYKLHGHTLETVDSAKC